MTVYSGDDATLVDFLERVLTPSYPQRVDGNEPSHGFLRIVCGEVIPPEERKERKRGMMPYYYRWPEETDKMLALVRQEQQRFDIYFTAHLTSIFNGSRDNIIENRTVQADLDHADITKLPFDPVAIVETSKGRHQGYWVLTKSVSIDRLEQLSRRLAHAIPDCDPTGWVAGHLMRLPTTTSYKHDGNAVRVVSLGEALHDPERLQTLPEPSRRSIAVEERLRGVLVLPDTPPEEILEKYKKKLPKSALNAFREVAKDDRSKALYALECACFRAGMSFEETYLISRLSANNKFSDRINGDADLLRDVVRAEQEASGAGGSIKEKILAARDVKLPFMRKVRKVFEIVYGDMTDNGRFVRTFDDFIWYLPKDTGRPIAITRNSEQLSALLSMVYGLNSTEKEQHFVVADLISKTLSEPPTVYSAVLSFYDDANLPRSVVLHPGGREVLRITADDTKWVTNGTLGTLFQWDTENDVFSPRIAQAKIEQPDWGAEVFAGVFNNVTGYTPKQAEALLKVWFLFLILRSGAVTRPILATFGPQGSGKTTLMQRLYRLLYGKRKDVSAIRGPDKFDQDVIHNPFVVFDGVDTSSAWLPDSLSLAAGMTEITSRKLFTDADKVRLKRQALVGVSAHNPRFGRPDVVDRMLMFTFKRLAEFLPSKPILQRIDERRDVLWGAIVLDIQKVLRIDPTTMPKAPNFRVQDFAAMGLWIATAIGVADEFRAALEINLADQRSFVIEEETTLLAALATLMRSRAKSNGHVQHWQTTHALWTQLESYSGDPQLFRKQYPDAATFGRKLRNLEHQTKDMYDLASKLDGAGVRLWNVSSVKKEQLS